MSPVTKLAAFAVLLLAVFGGGLAVGAVAGPFDDGEPPPQMEHSP